MYQEQKDQVRTIKEKFHPKDTRKWKTYAFKEKAQASWRGGLRWRWCGFCKVNQEDEGDRLSTLMMKKILKTMTAPPQRTNQWNQWWLISRGKLLLRRLIVPRLLQLNQPNLRWQSLRSLQPRFLREVDLVPNLGAHPLSFANSLLSWLVRH